MKGDTTRGLDEDPAPPVLPLFSKPTTKAPEEDDEEPFGRRCRSCTERARQPLRPLSDVLFVRPDPLPSTTRWGIVLPDDPRVNKAVWTGIVLAAGPGFLGKDGRRRVMQVAVGDRVVFPRYSAQVLPGEEPAVWSLLEREVLATCGADVVLTDGVVKKL